MLGIAASDIAGQKHAFPWNEHPVEHGNAFQLVETSSERMVRRGTLRLINFATDDPESPDIAGNREHVGQRIGPGSGLERGRRKNQKLLAEWGTGRNPAAPADYQSRVRALDRLEQLRGGCSSDASLAHAWIRQSLGGAPVMIACFAVVLLDVVAVARVARAEKLMRRAHRGKAHVHQLGRVRREAARVICPGLDHLAALAELLGASGLNE